jgi:hypothetical protein
MELKMPDINPNMPEPDLEGQMAKSELYRAAKHSMKLFQMIQDGQQLEGWVQAKITKAADYLDTIYHYMEYQVKFGGGGVAASVDDITGDMDAARSVAAKDEEDDEDEVKIKEGLTYEQRLQALLEAKVKKFDELRNPNSKIKAGSVRDINRQKTIAAAKKGIAHQSGGQPSHSGAPAKTTKGEIISQAKATKKHTEKSVEENTKVGDTKKTRTGDYSAKKARAGKDIGKPGKNFAKIAAKAEKSGAKSGEAVAGAVLKKLRAKG